MPELIGQRVSGTPLSERQCFELAIEHCHGLRDSLRGLALLRADTRWLIPVRLIEKMEDSIRKLMVKGGPRIVLLPDRYRQ